MPIKLLRTVSQRHLLITASSLVLCGFAITGCSGTAAENNDPHSETAATSSSPDTPTPSLSPSPSASTQLESLPVDMSCEQLMPPDSLYKFSPNFSFQGDAQPVAGSAAERALGLQGISCTYINLSGGDTITLSLAKLTPESISLLGRELAGTSSQAPSYISGAVEQAYFSSSSGVTEINVLTSTYWVSCTSSLFSTPEDAAKFLSLVTRQIPA